MDGVVDATGTSCAKAALAKSRQTVKQPRRIIVKSPTSRHAKDTTVNSMRYLRTFIVVLVFAACAHAEEPQVNILTMGDWGNNGPKQKHVAATLARYVQASG